MPPILTAPTVLRRPRAANKTRRSSDLTPDEQTNAKAALRVLLARYGTTRKLAEAMVANIGTIKEALNARGGFSAGVAGGSVGGGAA